MGQEVVHALDTPEVPYFVNDHGLDSLFNVTLDDAAGVLEAGTVLGMVTATGKYVAYTDAATNGVGSDTAVGILYHRRDTTAGETLASMQVQGTVRRSRLTGLTAAAEADLALFFFTD